MKKRYFKIFAALALVAILALSLFSCGQSAPASVSGQLYEGKTADGTTASFKWDYEASSGTLTVTGLGNMPNATSAANVPWANVRSYVKTVNFINRDNVPITSIGDYAFYGMSQLKTINLPDDITSIGKLAFGFCMSLQNVSIKNNIDTVGESAFEGCLSLTSITLPAGVTTLGDRAFAYCKNLKTAIIAGNLASIGKWTFKDCAALETLKLRDTFNKASIASDAFEGSKMTADKIAPISLLEGGKVNIIIQYVDTNGATVFPSETKTLSFGESYVLKAIPKDGWAVIDGSTKAGVATENGTVVKFTYRDLSAPVTPSDTSSETTPTDTEKADPEGITTGTVIGMVIFFVVLIGLGIAIFIFMRPAKDNGKNTPNNKSKKK